MTFRTVARSAGAALLALAVSACGLVSAAPEAAEDEAPPKRTGISRRDFIARADAVCARLRISELDANASYGEAKRWAKRETRKFEDILVDLYSIDPPPDERAQVDAFLGEWDDALQHFRDALRATLLGDDEGYRDAIRKLRRVARHGDKLARRYGLRTCADGSAPADDATAATGDSTLTV